jgi:hypothetical protein
MNSEVGASFTAFSVGVSKSAVVAPPTLGTENNRDGSQGGVSQA